MALARRDCGLGIRDSNQPRPRSYPQSPSLSLPLVRRRRPLLPARHGHQGNDVDRAGDGAAVRPDFSGGLVSRALCGAVGASTSAWLRLGAWWPTWRSRRAWSTGAAEHGVPSRWAYALTEPKAILHYLGFAVWPYPQCAFYAWPVAASWRRDLAAHDRRGGVWLGDHLGVGEAAGPGLVGGVVFCDPCTDLERDSHAGRGCRASDVPASSCRLDGDCFGREPPLSARSFAAGQFRQSQRRPSAAWPWPPFVSCSDRLRFAATSCTAARSRCGRARPPLRR